LSDYSVLITVKLHMKVRVSCLIAKARTIVVQSQAFLRTLLINKVDHHIRERLGTQMGADIATIHQVSKVIFAIRTLSHRIVTDVELNGLCGVSLLILYLVIASIISVSFVSLLVL
jgi:hypothetical protein